jgi:hypothetical protein
MERTRVPAAVVCGLVTLAAAAPAQDPPPSFTPPAILPAMLGLPDTNRRTASPDEVRIYRQGDNGKVNRAAQTDPYPKHPLSDVTLEDGEEAQFHNALDLSSRRNPKAAPEPLPFKAGVYGTVLYAARGKILVMTPQGTVLHYLHASEADVRFGDQVAPDTVLGKTGNWWPGTQPYQKGPIHLHLQATDRQGKLLDVDGTFLAGRQKPPTATPLVPPPGDWANFEPNAVASRKPVVENGVLKVVESKRVYYDDGAPKGKGPAAKADGKGKAAAANPLVGTWKGTGTTDRGKKFSGTLTLAEGGTATYAGDLIQPDGSAKVATVTGTWARAGDAVQITWKGAVQPVTLKLSGNTLTDRIPNTPAGNLTLTFEKQ